MFIFNSYTNKLINYLKYFFYFKISRIFFFFFKLNISPYSSRLTFVILFISLYFFMSAIGLFAPLFQPLAISVFNVYLYFIKEAPMFKVSFGIFCRFFLCFTFFFCRIKHFCFTNLFVVLFFNLVGLFFSCFDIL